MRSDLDREAALALTPVSRETQGRLDTYVDLLRQWQRVKNLVAPSTLDTIWTRHVADSAQLLPYLENSKTVIDIGSGAGFPGMVLAILKMEQADFRMHLVESNGRKASFLREAARVTGAPVTVHAERVEDFVQNWRGNADYVTARALASLRVLLDHSAKLLKTGAKALFLKGQDVGAELTEASKYWNIEAETIPSITDPGGRIVRVISATPRN